MFGPSQLTHVVYVLLVIAFTSVIAYMVYYNRRSKALQQSAEKNGARFASKEGAILAAEKAKDNESRKHAA